MDLQFDALEKSDLDAVMAIETIAFPQPWTREMFEKEIILAVSHFFVVRFGGRIIGYGGFWQAGDEGQILSLAVDESVRSRGFGRLILQFLCEEMRRLSLRMALLEVRSLNSRARSLYGSEGFIESGIRTRYYGDDDAVLMGKQL